MIRGPAQLTRYQFSNLLDSALLELDDQAQIVSYEEYFPFGSTSCQTIRSPDEVPKQYRYTGKERDEESGLCYHGARHYAPLIMRWNLPGPHSHQRRHGPLRLRKVQPSNKKRPQRYSRKRPQENRPPIYRFWDKFFTAKCRSFPKPKPTRIGPSGLFKPARHQTSTRQRTERKSRPHKRADRLQTSQKLIFGHSKEDPKWFSFLRPLAAQRVGGSQDSSRHSAWLSR